MRKNLLVFSLVTLLMLVSGASALANWTGTITVWDFPRPPEIEEWQMEMFAQFEEEFPGVTVDYTKLSWGDGLQKLDIAVAANNPPDLAGSLPAEKYLTQGVLEPLNPYLTEADLDDFYEAMLGSFTYEGNIYALPWYAVFGAVYLNLDIFEERGVEPPKDGMWTYDEFLETAKQLTFDRNGDGRIDVWGLSFALETGHLEIYPFIFGEGGRIMDEDQTQFTFDSPEALKGIGIVRDLVMEHEIAPPDTGGMTSSDSWDLFFGDQRGAAMTVQWGWAINTLRQHNADVEAGDIDEEPINWTLANYPMMSGGENLSVSPGVAGWGVFKQNDPAKAELVAELARRMTSTESQMANLPYIGTFPSRQSAGRVYDDDAILSIAMQMNPISRPYHPSWGRMDEIISRELQLIVLDRKTPEQGMSEAARRIQRLLR